jgi:hypothetical protein
VESGGIGSAVAPLNAVFRLTVTADGVGTATAVRGKISPAGLVDGKYAPEHADALRETGAATGFASEHADALSEIGRAGV